MRISTVPIEAYRQATTAAAEKDRAASQETTDPKQTVVVEKIFLPGINDADAGSVRVTSAPSFLGSVLTGEEQDMLVRHFARFGDSLDRPPVYGHGARSSSQAGTGIKVDVKA